MKKYNKLIGNYCEHIACTYLSSNNYKIIDRNFRTRLGEIDIICFINDTIIIIEVKGRYFMNFGMPCECVSTYKQHNIINAARFYITSNNLHKFNIRFDVIEVILDNKNNLFNINHIKDAFRLN